MQFFLILAVLATLASIHLLHQFWSRELEPDQAADAAADATPPEQEAPVEALRAA